MATWAPEHLAGNNENEFFGEWSSTPAGSSLWNTPPSGMTTPSQLFGWQSYDRGAMTYEALRAAIGDPAFFQLIKQWQTDFGGQTKRWTDLIDLAEQISGRNLDAFFLDWIGESGKPAWPGKLSLVLAATPGSGAVAAGSTVTYQLTATNTGKVPLAGAVVSVESLRRARRRHHRGAARRSSVWLGTTLTWTVPTTPVSTPGNPSVATTSFPVTRPAGRHPGPRADGDEQGRDPRRRLPDLRGHPHRQRTGRVPAAPTRTEHVRPRVPGRHHRQGQGRQEADGAC